MIRLDSPATAAIRPVRPTDRPALAGFFEDLSLESRYLRFFAPVRPTASLLHVLSGGPANVDAVVAVADGVIVGHAMATDRVEAQTDEDPRGARVTEIGVVVADAWQHRGVGTALMRTLITRAQGRGVTLLAMDVLPSNRRMLALITGHWPEAVITHSPDSLDIRIPLPRLPLPQSRMRTAPQLVQALISLGNVALIARARRDARPQRERVHRQKLVAGRLKAPRIRSLGRSSAPGS